jgi:hypothetical protein
MASLAKYHPKDLLADYANIVNENKSRVYEYKNTQLEMGMVLKDIHAGQADWKKYQEIKFHSRELGREIYENYDAHRLYLNQLGITRERLEISLGLRQRPLSRIELFAKNNVELYVEISQETQQIFDKMKRESFNILKHSSYGEYARIRKIRNDLAGEILANYPLHREFINQVNQASRGSFISKKCMENQLAYAAKIAEKSSPEEDFFKKLGAARRDRARSPVYGGSTVADRMVLGKNAYKYEERFADHFSKFGYYPHVSKSMMFAYCGENGLHNGIHSGLVANEYASILVHREMQKNPSLEIIENAIKQALCFKALQNASGLKELSCENIAALHGKASVLAGHITKENLHVLNDRNLMKTAVNSIKFEKSSPLFLSSINRLAEVNHSDIAKQQCQEMGIIRTRSQGMEI